MWQRFSEQSRQAILNGQEGAVERGGSQVDTIHLLMGVLLLSGSAGATILHDQGVTVQAAGALLSATPTQGEKGAEPKLSRASRMVLEAAANEARLRSDSCIGTAHLAIALARASGTAAPLLAEKKTTPEVLRARLDSLPDEVKDEAQPAPSRSGPSPLHEVASRLKRWIGREKE